MKWLAAALIAAAATLVAAVLAGAWLLGSEPGLQWAAERLRAASDGRFHYRELHGTLAGEMRFAELGFADGDTRVALAAGELRLGLVALLGGQVDVRSLAAQRLEIAPGGAAASKEPGAPTLPLGVRVQRADIGRVALREHVAEEVRVHDALLRQDGSLSASASLRVPHERFPAQLQLKLGGSLARLELALSGELAQVSLFANAVVTPGAAQPVAALEARAGPVDLRRFDAAWPRTALTLGMRGERSGAALAGTLSLANAEPGALDAARLPVANAQARFSTDLATASLEELRIALLHGGVLAGSGKLAAGRAELDLRASGVDLRAVRSTLRETRLAGPLHLRLEPKAQSLQGTLTHEAMTLSADVVRSGELVDIRSLRASANGGVATGSARLRLGEPLRFEARLNLSGFDPARFGDYPAGSLSGEVKAQGTLGKAPSVHALWDIAESTFAGQPFASRGSARVSGRRVMQADARATLGGAQLVARGGFGGAGDALEVELEAPQLAQFFAEVSGRLSASATLSGSWQAPRARVQAKASALRLPGGVSLASLSGEAQGSLEQHEASFRARAEDVDLRAELRGGWHGAAGWRGELRGLRNVGRFPLELTAPAPLAFSRRSVALGRLAARLGAGRLTVDEVRWSEGSVATSGEFQRLPAQWLLLAGGLTERLRASLLLDGGWDLRASPRLNGTLSLRRAAGDVTLLEAEPLALGLEQMALEARFRESEVQASGEVVSRYAAAQLAGRVAPEAGASGVGLTPRSPASFEARVRFADLRVLAQPFVQDARVQGKLAAELQARGTLSGLAVTGSLTGEEIGLDVPPYGVFLERGELRAVLEGDALRIAHFSIRAGDGELTAQGRLPLRADAAAASVAWRAERFRLLARPDLRLTLSGTGEAELAERRVKLTGELRADRGFLDLEQERLPQLGEDVVIVGEPARDPRERARLPVALDVLLHLGEDLQVRGHGLEGKLTGKLQVVTTPAGELRAYGRIETVNATFLAYGQRLQVDPGVATFDGPIDNPTLQMTAWRRNQQVEAGVQVTGTARNPRVQIVSQPPVPEGERLSWLVLGRAPSDATKADLGLLQAAAGALLARGEQAPLDRRIARAFGLDEISLRGTGEVADRVVAVGKRLSDRLYVSYEHGLGAAASALVKLDLALTQRLSVRAQTGTSSGVGLFYRFSWD